MAGSEVRSGAGRRVTLLLLDGARADVFEHLVSAGQLPHISRHLLEPGGTVPAVTVFPSTTGVAYLPFLTGCYPGTCNVPGIRWLDPRGYAGRWLRDRVHLRSYCGPQSGLLNSDIPHEMPTLFDMIPDSVALCSPFNRGLPPSRDRVKLQRAFWGAVAHYTGYYDALERAVGNALCGTVRERPRFVFAVFPGVDGVTHFWDPWHPDVLDMYRAFDGIVGRYAAAGGFDGDQLTLLVSDHGLSRVDRHTDVALALERDGVPVLHYPFIWRRNPQVAVMISGNGSAQLYLRPGVRRPHRHTVEAIEEGEVAGISRHLVRDIAALPGVALVAGTSESGVELVSHAGRATLLELPDGRIEYRHVSGDVLGLGQGVRGEREWFEGSLAARFPDAPVQLTQLFRSPRAGDLVVTAAEGFDLRFDWEVPEHRSGHGSLVHDHMRCLVAANQQLPAAMRTVDLFPLVLNFLGLPIPLGIDGRVPQLDEERRIAG
jgi:hypothetical protein